jgi:hypothetical protein
MNYLRKHWYDLGGILAVIVLVYICVNISSLTDYELLMWLSLVGLFFHQMEEYRIAGTFPGMINTVMFNSNIPDRYPLNTNSAFIINVFVSRLAWVSNDPRFSWKFYCAYIFVQHKR